MNIVKRFVKELTDILITIYQVLYVDPKYRYETYYIHTDMEKHPNGK